MLTCILSDSQAHRAMTEGDVQLTSMREAPSIRKVRLSSTSVLSRGFNHGQ